ncbi:aminoglycoside phosphotransferase (APT) family kinase protein [Amycolatopsis lexingtonensis]|uniref:Aminoglycoside phosphotransferase (APT) family kinase protein n=1 Tax=Amycolatopsis lexingtonensis TaxID=218822 RepID=A0ABR9I1X1_9PSEU|nr:aminoglycoside phosphotransferase family protein [Amycolatopsis lexingtonensis]MBE1497160.1 aminoglycoside phosphotransferase (APT) family kinase protein [Amycolatopsis lexingtonensis]
MSLGPPPQRIEVTADQVRQLVAEQFPQWAGLAVRPVANGGWDNRTFHLGDTMSARLPSAAEYALSVDKEQRWLPVLAPRLPLPIPVPLAEGKPGADYPFPWSILPWLDGEQARADRIADPVAFAADLAGFLAALQDVDPAGAPGPGKHNWFRGDTLRTYDELVRHRLDGLTGKIWQVALDARWDGVPRWFHGDVAAGNLLLHHGKLAAVIDFGSCGAGDPACDVAIAWTLLTTDGREVFRERLAIDDATWARGRGWALWKTLVTLARASGREAAEAQRVLDEIRTEYR